MKGVVLAGGMGSRHEVFPLTHADLDIATLEATRKVLAGIRPTLIVNTAAMHHVENCEKEPLKAYQIMVWESGISPMRPESSVRNCFT